MKRYLIAICICLSPVYAFEPISILNRVIEVFEQKIISPQPVSSDISIDLTEAITCQNVEVVIDLLNKLQLVTKQDYETYLLLARCQVDRIQKKHRFFGDIASVVGGISCLGGSLLGVDALLDQINNSDYGIKFLLEDDDTLKIRIVAAGASGVAILGTGIMGLYLCYKGITKQNYKHKLERARMIEHLIRSTATK